MMNVLCNITITIISDCNFIIIIIIISSANTVAVTVVGTAPIIIYDDTILSHMINAAVLTKYITHADVH